ncbi:MAG: hypothetical protein MJ108_04955 [Saccharofermentans sp.]|nr:hypothetical protein [Saccharofermentans sp.]
MRERKGLIGVIVLATTAILVLLLMRSMVDQYRDYYNSVSDGKCRELAANMESNDYTIIWIGTPYDDLDKYVGDHLVVMSPDEVSMSNMPICNYFQKVQIKDENGVPIKYKTRDEFATNIFIVVNVTEELKPETIEVIRQCVANTNCELLAIGNVQCECFREALLLPKADGEEEYFLYNSISGIDLNFMAYLDDKYEPCQRILRTFYARLPLPKPAPVVVETYSSEAYVVETQPQATLPTAETEPTYMTEYTSDETDPYIHRFEVGEPTIVIRGQS